ncbi:MAG: hypothetical protein Tsb0033_02610 [Winogradskyella sp.]
MINKTAFTLLLSIFCISAFIYSCDNEPQPISFETNIYEYNYEANISVAIDEAKENSETGKVINFKIQEAIISTLSEVTKKTSLESILDDFNAEFIAFKKQFPEVSHPVWELHIETEKIYQSNDIITLAINTYEFKGGAHGNDKIKFLNLNANTGEILNLDDMVENSEDFKALARNYFLKSMESDKESSQIEDYFFGESFQLPENIGFSDEGLVFLYNVYEIASYSQGYTEFVIPFDAVGKYLKVR